MALYWCFICGENFPPLDDTDRLMGFYAGRYVDASSANEAEQAALEMLRSEYQFSEAQRAKAPSTRIYFEEIFEVEPESRIGPNKGAVWFEMENTESATKAKASART